MVQIPPEVLSEIKVEQLRQSVASIEKQDRFKTYFAQKMRKMWLHRHISK